MSKRALTGASRACTIPKTTLLSCGEPDELGLTVLRSNLPREFRDTVARRLRLDDLRLRAPA